MDRGDACRELHRAQGEGGVRVSTQLNEGLGRPRRSDAADPFQRLGGFFLGVLEEDWQVNGVAQDGEIGIGMLFSVEPDDRPLSGGACNIAATSFRA